MLSTKWPNDRINTSRDVTSHIRVRILKRGKILGSPRFRAAPLWPPNDRRSRVEPALASHGWIFLPPNHGMQVCDAFVHSNDGTYPRTARGSAVWRFKGRETPMQSVPTRRHSGIGSPSSRQRGPRRMGAKQLAVGALCSSWPQSIFTPNPLRTCSSFVSPSV